MDAKRAAAELAAEWAEFDKVDPEEAVAALAEKLGLMAVTWTADYVADEFRENEYAVTPERVAAVLAHAREQFDIWDEGLKTINGYVRDVAKAEGWPEYLAEGEPQEGDED